MLTRWSMVKPDYEMPSIGIADFWLSAFTNPDFENEVVGWQYFGDGKTKTIKGQGLGFYSAN